LNLGDIKRRARNIVGDESGVFLEDADLLDYANDGLVDLARKTEFLKTSTTISVVANTAEYALPADFIVEKRATLSGTSLRHSTLELLDQLDVGKDVAGNTDSPYFFYIWGNKVGLYPTPSTAVVNGLKIWYVQAPTLLAADGDVPGLPIHMHEDIVRYVVARCREQADDLQGAGAAMGDYENRITLSKDQASNPDATSYPSIRDIDAGYP
jgi:hypothetical protein